MNRSVKVGAEALNRVDNRFAQASLGLQMVFPLRREEAIKFTPSRAIRGNRIVLQGSWCKGGRGREIAVRTRAQREALAFAAEVAGKGSLIPPSLDYKTYRDGPFRAACDQAGVSRTHGFRHAWAQDRYREITRKLDARGVGWECPVRGGPTRDQLTPAQFEIDRYARMVIVEDLGHSRLSSSYPYLGR